MARAVSECTSFARYTLGPRTGFRILLYHAVGSSIPQDAYGLSISPKLFEQHMAALAALHPSSIVPLYEGQTMIADLRVAVTFDDGFKDNFTTAAPILVKYRIPCTVFVASSFLRSPSALYLTREELKELAALPGVTIGSHGLTHNRLTACDEATLWRELTESRKEIEDIIGRPVMAISYPHGSVNRRIADTARLAGYALGACSRSDINHIGRDPLLLCRTEVVAADSKRVFLQKLNGGWDWCRWRRTDPAR